MSLSIIFRAVSIVTYKFVTKLSPYVALHQYATSRISLKMILLAVVTIDFDAFAFCYAVLLMMMATRPLVR